MKNAFLRRGIGFIFVIALTLFFPAQADAGKHRYHERTTFNALLKSGFNYPAYAIVMVGNLATDVYNELPILTRGIIVNGPISGETVPFHFDNLFTAQEVAEHWQNLEAVTKDNVQKIVSDMRAPGGMSEENNKLFLLLAGVTLHAAQDFYSHSNWVEKWDEVLDGSSIPTWHEALTLAKNGDARAKGVLEKIFTGAYSVQNVPEGIKTHDEMNKDSPSSESGKIQSKSGRTYYQLTEKLAQKTTEEWIGKLKEWTNDDALWPELIKSAHIGYKGRLEYSLEFAELASICEAVDRENWQGVAILYNMWGKRSADLSKKIFGGLSKGFKRKSPHSDVIVPPKLKVQDNQQSRATLPNIQPRLAAKCYEPITTRTTFRLPRWNDKGY